VVQQTQVGREAIAAQAQAAQLIGALHQEVAQQRQMIQYLMRGYSQIEGQVRTRAGGSALSMGR
jgi:hypothetical protein